MGLNGKSPHLRNYSYEVINMGKCKTYQAYNKKNKAWVKYKFDKQGFEPLDVKQIKPKQPFKGIPIRGKRR